MGSGCALREIVRLKSGHRCTVLWVPLDEREEYSLSVPADESEAVLEIDTLGHRHFGHFQGAPEHIACAEASRVTLWLVGTSGGDRKGVGTGTEHPTVWRLWSGDNLSKDRPLFTAFPLGCDTSPLFLPGA